MNPLMLLQAGAPILEKLLSSGKLDALIPGQGLGALKEILPGGHGATAGPEQQVLAAIAMLAEHSPSDPIKGQAYSESLAEIMTGLTRLKGALKEEPAK